MELFISPYTKQSKLDRHGWRANFVIKNAPKKKVLTIYQNNYVITTITGNKPNEDLYTEAWRYDSKKVITDSFLIPVDMRKNTKGKVVIKTVTWVTEGPYNKSLRKSKGHLLNRWGLLYGKYGHLIIPHNVSKIHRTFEITWNNIGKINKKYFTNGKDLRSRTGLDVIKEQNKN